MKKFADVILPLPLHSCFTYSLPDEWADEVQIGCRVVVPFGRKKYYTAIVRNVHYCAPTEYEVKEVSALLDARPILLPRQFKFWEWLSDYYLCTQGDVYKAALPSGLKLESETIVEYNPDFESDVRLPEIIPVDIKELHRKKMMNSPFSPLLLQYIREALEQKEQVILFQNRRGFAPMIECNTCGWVPKCKNCDVSLTYHKGLNQLTCHYCGYTYQLPRICPACEGTDLRNRGFGTEKIEDDIKALFPDARVARMDLDTTRTRTAYERIISDFQQGKTDILIGTQMVSKGLDFDHVSIVGILNADTMLNYPDFRAYERAFQLMAQVAGRAGRKNKRGRVVLQTKSIDHPIIPQVIANDYEAMVGGQLAERQMFHYPPYYRLVYVYLKNRNETLLDLMAQTMAAKLRTVFGNRVLGPDKPPVARVQTLFIRKIVLKIETNAPMARARELLVQVQKEMVAEDRFKSLIVYYDVDPM